MRSVRTSDRLGRYRLVAEIGHGGMADVFLAVVEGPAGAGFAKLAVVKRLREHLAEDPELVALLMDEARITSRLQHPNIVQMLEIGQDGEYFLAMEYLDGQPFHRIQRRAVRAGVSLSESLNLIVLIDALKALDYAHSLSDYDGSPLGIVHRDVTPHNLFVTYDGHVKVMDFGVAKAAGRTSVTKHGDVRGKLRFMAPEQIVDRGAVDGRADIFAIGVLLYTALVGRSPWHDLDDMAVMQLLMRGAHPTSPREVRPDVDPRLDEICRQALAPRPQDRFATAGEMAMRLEAYLGAALLHARRQLGGTVRDLFESERGAGRALLETLGSYRATPESIASMATMTPRSDVTAVMSQDASPDSMVPFVSTPPRAVSKAPAHPPPATIQAPVPVGSKPVHRPLRGLVPGVAVAAAVAVMASMLTMTKPVERVRRVAATEVKPLVIAETLRAAPADEASLEPRVVVVVRRPDKAPGTPEDAANGTESGGTAWTPGMEPGPFDPPRPAVPASAPKRTQRGGLLVVDATDPWAN